MKSHGSRVQCTFEARDTYFRGDSVVILFLLRNDTEQDLQVLRWYNPLEGVRNRIFRVTGPDGKELNYRGILAKRGNPGRSSYATVEARKTVIAKVDLAESYRFERSGKYRVEFTGGIGDHRFADKIQPRKMEGFQKLPLQCNALRFEVQ